jgi:serine/threonine-protein kinase RsbW
MVRTITGEAQLTLRSQMADLALVPPWIESLAAEYGISDSTQFAMNLCLEEVLSNIIRHGYANSPDRTIVIRYLAEENNTSVLVVDDQAPPFNPLAAESHPVEETLDGTRLGGLGIRLLRSFAATLEYEPTPGGNRLIMGFVAA